MRLIITYSPRPCLVRRYILFEVFGQRYDRSDVCQGSRPMSCHLLLLRTSLCNICRDRLPPGRLRPRRKELEADRLDFRIGPPPPHRPGGLGGDAARYRDVYPLSIGRRIRLLALRAARAAWRRRPRLLRLLLSAQPARPNLVPARPCGGRHSTSRRRAATVRSGPRGST